MQMIAGKKQVCNGIGGKEDSPMILENMKMISYEETSDGLGRYLFNWERWRYTVQVISME